MTGRSSCTASRSADIHSPVSQGAFTLVQVRLKMMGLCDKDAALKSNESFLKTWSSDEV